MNQTILSSPFINVHLLLFLLIVLLLSAETSLAVDFYFQNCSVPTTCGGQNISYPFFIPGRQQSFCGYPGFELSCHEDDDGDGEPAYPLLQLSGNNYTVRSINYQSRSLRVSNSLLSDYLSDSACKEFPSLENSSLPNDRYELLPHQAEIFLLHNCSSSALVDSFSRYKIGCLGGNTSEALALPRAEYLKFRNARDNNCRGEVVVAHVQGNGNGKMKEEIKRGFEIKWLASDCDRCQTTRGVCGFNFTTRHFRCFCPDRTHTVRCRDDQDDQGWWSLSLPSALIFFPVHKIMNS